MAIEGFDYKSFAKSMAGQAKKLVPNDLDDYAKEYLVKKVKKFTYLTGKALYNDKSINISAEDAVFMTQIISEWTFHKCIDLANSGIEPKYWDVIMEKIGFTSFEVIKQGILRKWSQDEVLETVEQQIVKVYKECIEKLCEGENISGEVAEIAKSQSNIDKMAGGMKSAKNEKDSVLKIHNDENIVEEVVNDKSSVIEYFKSYLCVGISFLVILCTCCSIFYYLKPSEDLLRISVSILYLFSLLNIVTKKFITDFFIIFIPLLILSGSILMLIFHYNYAWVFLFASIVMLIKSISIGISHDIQAQLQELENVKKQMEDLINPDRMYDNLGIDIISIIVGRALNSIIDADQEDSLLPNIVALRKRLTETYGYIIPNVSMSKSDDLDEYEYQIKIRNNLVLSDIINLKKVTLSETVEKIIQELSKCVMEHVDLILTESDVDKYIAIVKNTNPSQVKYLQEKFSTYDIRKLFVNLIKDKVSIRDVGFIFMKLNEFSAETTNIEVLSKKLKEVLKK